MRDCKPRHESFLLLIARGELMFDFTTALFFVYKKMNREIQSVAIKSLRNRCPSYVLTQFYRFAPAKI